MNQPRALLVQTLIEAIIPVAGYFYWDWDASFILMFYLLDWLLFLSLTIAKARKRLSFSGQHAEKSVAINNIAIGIGACLATCSLVYLTLPNLFPQFDWKERAVAFWSYSDMGIQQGFILIPLMALNGYMLYKQQFIMPTRFRTQTMKELVQPAVRQGLILAIAAGICYGISALISYPSEILIGLAVVGTSAYRILFRR